MTSSYKTRQAINPTKRNEKIAKDYQAATNAYIRDSTQQQRELEAENRRSQNIYDFVSNKELKDLSNLSDTFKNFLEQGVVPATKAYWDGQIEKGRLDYKLRDEDPQQIFYNTEAEVNNALTNSELLDNELAANAENLPTETQKQELEQLSGFRKLGWKLQAVDDAALNFPEWRLNELTSSTEEITVDGVTFQIKEAQPGVQYEAASDYLFKKYVFDHKGDLSEKYILTKFLPHLEKAEFLQKSEYYKKDRINNANNQIDAINQVTYSKLNGDNTTVDDIVTSIKTNFISLKNSYEIISPRGGVNAALRSNFKTTVETFVKANPFNDAKIQKLKEALNIATIPGHPSKDKSIAELYPAEFSNDQIDRIVENEQARLGGIQTRLESAGKHSVMEKLQTLKNLDPDSTELQELLESGIEVNGITTPVKNVEELERHYLREFLEFNPTTQEIAEFKTLADRDVLNAIQTVTLLNSKKQLGIISERDLVLLEKTFNLDTEVVKEFRADGVIIEKPFYEQVTEETSKEVNTIVTNSLKRAMGELGHSSTAGLAGIPSQVKESLVNDILLRARDIYKIAERDGIPKTVDQAALEATVLELQKFNDIQRNDLTNHKYYITPEVWAFDNWGVGSNLMLKDGVTAWYQRNRHASEWPSKSGNSPINTLYPNIVNDDFVILKSTGGQPKDIFYKLAASDDKINAYDVYNAQLELFLEREGIDVNQFKGTKGLFLDGEAAVLNNELLKRRPIEIAMLKKHYALNPEDTKAAALIQSDLGIVSEAKMESRIADAMHDALIDSSSENGVKLYHIIRKSGQIQYRILPIINQILKEKPKAIEIEIVQEAFSRLTGKPRLHEDVLLLTKLYKYGDL